MTLITTNEGTRSTPFSARAGTPAGEELVLLVDNGSLAPASTLGLRKLARALAKLIDRRVDPVSILHSDQVPREQLEDIPAETLVAAIAARFSQGWSKFVVIPLFFGPSRALTEFIPDQVRVLRRDRPDLQVKLTAPLFDAADDRLARILADHVRAIAPRPPARVALVDHGSPVSEVTAVRDALARQMNFLLGEGYDVRAASMERRAGARYDFNEPLLASLLQQPGWNQGEVIVALQFLLPGKHAGPDGDVATICREAQRSAPSLQTKLTDLVGFHPRLPQILADRFRSRGRLLD